MKNAFILLLVALAVIFFDSCKKCYQCQNQCSVCRKQRHDTTLTIVVASQNLTEQYYIAYLDSLQSADLGWVCKDTASNYSQQFCASSKQSNGDLLNEEALGYVCN